MNFEQIKVQASALFTDCSFIAHINDSADYDAALALMAELVQKANTWSFMYQRSGSRMLTGWSFRDELRHLTLIGSR